MAITEERMLRLISVAETCRDATRGLHDALVQWRANVASGNLDANGVIDAALRYINLNLPSPFDLATIELERRHFESNRGRNAYSRRRMAALRNGEPRKQFKRQGYTTEPHNPTGKAIAERVAPSVKPLTESELDEMNRQMAADKAMLTARALPKVPFSLPPPDHAPTNPYIGDGMPDVRAEPAETELTIGEARAKVDSQSEQEPPQ